MAVAFLYNKGMKKLSSFFNRNDTFFRAGAGMFIYTSNNKFIVFERKRNPGSFQFPQGGRDKGESFEETLWRELEEEVALKKEDFTGVDQFPDLLSYEYLAKDVPIEFDWLGQTHRWFYLGLKDGTQINLDNATEPEFISYKVATEKEILSEIYVDKREVYKRLFEYFNKEIK